MKKIFLLCCASLQLGLYAQDVPVAAGEALPAGSLPAEVYSEEDPFADLFGEANDIVVESQDAPLPEPADGPATEHPDPFFKPLSFFGHLKAEAGVAGFYEDGTFDGTGLFLFKNEFGMTARASKYLGMKGTLVVQYPDFSLSVGSLYFDYLLLDKIYISGGKKPVNWGYILLFSDLSLFDFSIQKNWLEETEYVPTNILSDSEDMISLHIQIPVWTGAISGVVLYPIESARDIPSMKDLSFAGSFELTMLSTAVNLFGRRNPVEDNVRSQNTEYNPSVFGIELKRSVIGFDVYGQTVVGIHDVHVMDTPAGYDSIITTAGLYRLWDGKLKIGFNFEYQHEYNPQSTVLHTHRTALLGGLSGFGPRRGMKIGFLWRHKYVVDEGDLSLGLTVSNVLPHANWKVGMEMAYGDPFRPVPKFTLATSVVLVLDY